MRKLLLLALVLTSFFQWPSPSQAKGLADRIVISSSSLTEDIIVEDDGIVLLLSYHMMDYEQELIVPPANVDVGYQLERQYKDGATFRTFDKVAYYPRNDSAGGYVHYIGIVDGWSEYDDKWYRVRPQADMAMQYLLNSQHLADYIITYQTNGQFHLLDPVTLETVHILHTSLDEWAYAINDGYSLDGTKIFFQRSSGDHVEEYYLDLSNQQRCSMGNHAFIMPTLDGQHLLFQVNNTVEMRHAETFELVATLDDIAPDDLHYSLQFFTEGSHINAFGATWDTSTRTGEMIWLDALTFEIIDQVDLDFERPVLAATRDATYGVLHASDGFAAAEWNAWDHSLDFARPVRPLSGLQKLSEAGAVMELIGSHHGEQYYYPRIGRYWKLADYDIAGGIMIMRQEWADEEISWLQSDVPFQHVIMQGNHLYALEVPLEGEIATIYRLDLNSGEILNSVEISTDVHRLGYARLDTGTLNETNVTFGTCSTQVLFD